MSNHLKRQVIHHLAEQSVPATYDPWDAVKMRLEKNQTGPKKTQQTRMDMALRSGLNRRFAVVLAMLLIFLVGIVFFLTPQGQVTAKHLFQFFRKADSNVLPLPTGLPTERVLPTRTPVPTQFIGLEAVQTKEPGVLVTSTPKEKTEQGTITYGLTISEAETLAKFAIRMPTTLPTGYRLTDVLFDSQTQAVQQIYKYFPYQSGEMFILCQQISAPTETIGLGAEIKQFQVGNVLVESAAGTWFTESGSNVQEWRADAAVQTFRWQQDGSYFTLQFMMGDTFSPAYVSKNDMQALVEIVIGTPAERPAKLDLNNMKSVEEVEQAAGFPFLAPTVLPTGFTLERAVYEPENRRAVFIYRPADTNDSMNHPSLILFEILKSDRIPPIPELDPLPPEAIEEVKIGEFSGTFQRGAMVDGKYDPNSGLSLHWETNDLSITINYSGSSSHPAQLEKTDMLKIAEGLQ